MANEHVGKRVIVVWSGRYTMKESITVGKVLRNNLNHEKNDIIVEHEKNLGLGKIYHLKYFLHYVFEYDEDLYNILKNLKNPYDQFGKVLEYLDWNFKHAKT